MKKLSFYHNGVRNHFKVRMKERFQIRLKDRHRSQIIAYIKKGKFKDITSYDFKERPIYRITWESRVLHVVYDIELEELVTALYPNNHTKYVHNAKKYKKENKKNRWKKNLEPDLWRENLNAL